MTKKVFLKITTYYDSFLKKFYINNKNSSTLSYDQHHQLLMNEGFAWSNFFQKNLMKFGYKAYEVIINDELLQKKWGKEYKFNYSGKNWQIDILLAQIRQYNPDVIFWEDQPSFLDESFISLINQQTSRKTMHIGFQCDVMSDRNIFKKFDIVLCCSEKFYFDLNKIGIESNLFRHAFETSILKKIGSNTKTIDVSFIGSVGSMNGPHSYRYELIQYLLQHTNLEIWTPFPGYKKMFSDNLCFFLKCIKSYKFKHYWLNNSIKNNIYIWKNHYPTRVHDAVYGINMFTILSQSKITINCHVNGTGNYAANMRLFEATGMGTLLITDWKENISDLFEPDKEIITYKTPEECVEMIQYYLEHDREREAIARAGQERTLNDHTYSLRMEKLDKVISNFKMGKSIGNVCDSQEDSCIR